ncbi:hypothetical protein [Streptomyces chattanoogensis]|uniref:hypothetical protein n=1 Tax=Streptomyces chattanoogensis TaxID=66876 RepID=UPI0036ABAA57
MSHLLGDTFAADQFDVELGRFQVATFPSLSGLTTGQDVFGPKQVSAAGELITHKQPDPEKIPEISLSRAMEQDTKFVERSSSDST